MPGRFCVIRSCKSSDTALAKYNKSTCDIHQVFRKNCDCNPPYKLRSFPANKDVFKLWCLAIKHEVPRNYFPKYGHNICSRHFMKPSDRVPSVNMITGNPPMWVNNPNESSDQRRNGSNLVNVSKEISEKPRMGIGDSTITDRDKMNVLHKKSNYSLSSALNSEDKSLLISNCAYKEFEQQKKVWFEKEKDNGKLSLIENANSTNQVSTNSMFIQHLLNSHKQLGLLLESSNKSNEFNHISLVSDIKAEPDDYIDYDEIDCDKITPD